MIDPRPSVFARRLRPIRRIVAIGGGKGGVGKTTVTTLTALAAASAGHRVGLLDLDIHGGAAHLFLGIEPAFPEEKGGILPFEGAFGLRFMSATSFSGDRPLALRGTEVSDAIAELLAVTVWPELDLLLIDLPPGLGESLLDILRFVPRAEIVAVTTPSLPAVRVAGRFLSAVGSAAPVLGVIANMVGEDPNPATEAQAPVAELAARFSVPLLASVPRDPTLESAIGKPEALLKTGSAAALAEVAGLIVGG
jgi:ATP-binding protein involved in chromosome partitioning